MAAVMVCSTAFAAMGRAQAKALGYPDLPITIVPHPFGLRSRDEIRQMAAQCADDFARLVCEGAPDPSADALARPAASASKHARVITVPGDVDALNALFMERRW